MVHRELKRAGVTLQLLWEEHRAAHPDGYGHSRFCEKYHEWKLRLSPTMRQTHVAGERLFVDYAGNTLEVIDGTSGEVRTAQLAGGPVLLRAPIEIDDYTRWRLMEGLDDISLTLRSSEEIARYERSRPEWMPAAG